MTAHCSTCNCRDEPIPPPATSSEWARRQARDATREAVDAARRRRTETAAALNRDKEHHA